MPLRNHFPKIVLTKSIRDDSALRFKAKSENSPKKQQNEANLTPVISCDTDEPKIINFLPSELPMVRYLFFILIKIHSS